MSRNGSLEDTWISYEDSFVCPVSLKQNIWNKVKRLGLGNFAIYFCGFFCLILPKSNFWKGNCALSYISAQI